MEKEITIEEIYEGLLRLHLARTWAYHNSWRRDGEVDPVTNILRKTDRLAGVLSSGIEEEKQKEKMFTSPVRFVLNKCLKYLDLPEPNDKKEGIFDTIADAGVYAGKYLTFLAWKYPEGFKDFFGVQDAGKYAFHDMPDEHKPEEMGEGFYNVIKHLVDLNQKKDPLVSLVTQASSWEDCLKIIEKYEPTVHDIKQGKMFNEARKEKFETGVMICLSAFKALTFIANKQPELWQSYLVFIDNEWKGLSEERRRDYSLRRYKFVNDK